MFAEKDENDSNDKNSAETWWSLDWHTNSKDSLKTLKCTLFGVFCKNRVIFDFED